ncbi:GGDEF domain-containing protein [Vibrio hannami]|uniref:GGDEF domain-containing protein n=1 Tax=Vibrio hannami TaxID=2717094 RepID=UPI00240ECDA2|nr:GGDEF domain-containing protein [Vibrio hannami]MDG3087746.1 GGDEF domain-containing protein [Vibrio hannami]
MSVRAELRLNHYIWLVFIAVPLSILFGIKNLWVGNFYIAATLGVFLGCIVFSLLLIPHVKNTEKIYHVNNFVFIAMVTLVSVWGAKSEGQILWSYTYPLLSISLFGHKYGLRWSIALLVIIMISLLYFDSLNQTYSYDFEARYCVTYLCIMVITTWLEYGRSRYIKESIEQKRSLESERKTLKREIKKRAQLEEELANLANIDDLTQLYNRRYFWLKANEEISRVRKLNSTLTVAVFDFDRFKKLNDQYGHPAGDEVLRKFGEMCRSSLRESDIVGRIGGEEFAVLLPFTNIEESKQIVRRLCQKISEHRYDFQGEIVGVTSSVGMCELSIENSSIERLYASADKALYEAKAKGRNQIISS